MFDKSSVRIAAALGLALMPLAAHAQDKPKPREFVADVGFVNTTGNSRVTTLNAGEKLILRRGKFEHKEQAGSVYGAQDGKQTSNLLFANWRTDYSLTKRLAVFGYVGYDRNTFSGIARRFEEAAGLAYKLLDTERDQWSVELGLAMNQQLSTTDSTTNFASVRSGSLYKHFFTKTAYFSEGLEFLPNLQTTDDYRINSESALVAPLSSHIAMKLAYVIRFDNVPEAKHVKTDRILTSGLQFNW